MIDLSAHGLIEPATPPRDIGGPPSIARLLDEALATDPERVVLVGRTGRHTVAELDGLSTRVAGALQQLGVGPGVRVAAALPNDDAIVIAFLGAMRAGAIWVGLNRPLAPPEKAYMLRDAQVSVLLADPDVADSIEDRRGDLPDLDHVIVVAPGDERDGWVDLLAGGEVVDLPEVGAGWPAAIAYTSGTTGFPKGAVHTHHNLLLPGKVGRRRLPAPDPDHPPIMGVALPLTILNLMVLGPIAAFQTGTPVVAMDRIDAVGMADWIERERITTFAAVPAMVHDLLTHPDVSDEMLASIEAIGVGGADMPEAFRRLYEERFGRASAPGTG